VLDSTLAGCTRRSAVSESRASGRINQEKGASAPFFSISCKSRVPQPFEARRARRPAFVSSVAPPVVADELPAPAALELAPEPVVAEEADPLVVPPALLGGLGSVAPC
jgi:hypothetical protein